VAKDVSFAGRHLLLELWEAEGLDQMEVVEKALTDAVRACGATLLDIRLHTFSPTGGISGVAIVSESHVSVHTWPEWKYAALDVFLCNSLDPYAAVPVFQEAFRPGKMQMMESRRGVH